METYGNHVTSDNAFKAIEIVLRKREITWREKKKERRIELAEAHTKGMEVVNLGKPVDELLVPDLDKVLDMHKVKKKGRGKRDQKRAKVAKLWSKPPPLVDQWTDADEAGLNVETS